MEKMALGGQRPSVIWMNEEQSDDQPEEQPEPESESEPQPSQQLQPLQPAPTTPLQTPEVRISRLTFF